MAGSRFDIACQKKRGPSRVHISETWLQVEAVSAAGLCDPVWRPGDRTKELFQGGGQLLRPYVSIVVDGATYSSHRRSEDISSTDKCGAVVFNRRMYIPYSSTVAESNILVAIYNLRNLSSLFVGDPLIGQAELNLPALTDEDGPIEQQLMLTRGLKKGASSSSLAVGYSSCNAISELVAQEEMCIAEGIVDKKQIAVLEDSTPSHEVLRRYSSDPTRESSYQGEQYEAASPGTRNSCFSSTSSIRSRGFSFFKGVEPTIHGTLSLRLNFVHLATSIRVLRRSRQFPLQTLARAIADVLRIPSFASLLLEARPTQLVSGSDDEARSALHDIIERLYSEAGEGICDSDSNMLRLMSRLARSILELSAEAMLQNHLPLEAVLELSVQWIQKFIFLIIEGTDENRSHEDDLPLAEDPEDRLRPFFAAAQIHIEQLEPIDKNGAVFAIWPDMIETEGLMDAIREVPKAGVLGVGTFGKVWRARDKHTGIHYAVKNAFVRNVSSGIVAERETQVANRICGKPHPCVVQVFHSGCFESEESDLFYIVMEICSGGDLSKIILDIRKKIKVCSDYSPPTLWRPWIGQIFLGLEHLHRKLDILMRDLKPENVILNHHSHAKLTDFGFSHIGIESNGGFGTFGCPPGTPHYISPEVVLGIEYDNASDIFSFGVLIWVLMTGGITVAPFPMPPCVDFQTEYSALSANQELLAKCIMDPEKNYAVPVGDSDCKDFILSLTRADPSERPSLEEIRSHKLVSPLQLPPFDCECNEVEAWIQSCSASK